MSLQQYCVRWNNHLKVFQSALPQYFQSQKFLDCTLVAEGQHFVSCHRLVLDACSDYFANFLKNKMFDDKNIVICLPKEVKLWQIQALLQFMYHGEVCISQEGLPSLVKCAELLQVKGLCGNEQKTITEHDNELDKVNKQSQSKHQASTQPQKYQNIGNQMQKNKLNRVLQNASNSNFSSSQMNQRNHVDNEENERAKAISSNDENGDMANELMSLAVEISENDSTNGPFIKREININDTIDDDEDDPNSNMNSYLSPMNGTEEDQSNLQQTNQSETENKRRNTNSSHSDQCSVQEEQPDELSPQKFGLIRVKNNLFQNFKGGNEVGENSHNDSGIIVFDNDLEMLTDDTFECQKDDSSSKNNLIYNRNSMDVFVKQHQNDFDSQQNSQSRENEDTHYRHSPFMMDAGSSNKQQFENIICAPNLLQYLTECENNDTSQKINSNMDGVSEEGTLNENNEVSTFYLTDSARISISSKSNMNQRFLSNDDTSHDIAEISISSHLKESPFVIASVSSLNQIDSFKKSKLEQEAETKLLQNLQNLAGEEKSSIGGLYLRNPRGNQIRQYDVNALYNALQVLD